MGQAPRDQQFPMKSFFDQGVTVASASDHPLSWPPDPHRAIGIGVRRTVPAGSEIYHEPGVKHALNPSESATVRQMTESFTRNGAWACFFEDEIGSRNADFIMLDQNILKTNPAEIHNTTVLLTYHEGNEVRCRLTYAEVAWRAALPSALGRVGGRETGNAWGGSEPAPRPFGHRCLLRVEETTARM